MYVHEHVNDHVHEHVHKHAQEHVQGTCTCTVYLPIDRDGQGH
jgi:hypothetical protein